MSVAEKIDKKFTEAEYLAIEREADVKSEFFDGEFFAMSGRTIRHSLIATNVSAELRARLMGRCTVFNSDLRIKVEATGLFAYPDVSVVCGPRDLLDDQEDVLLNPSMLVEVLSDSTEAYDRGAKFENYRQIPSLNQYLLAHQRKPMIELYTRQPNSDWLLQTAAGLEDTLDLPKLEVALPLADVYRDVRFTDDAAAVEKSGVAAGD